jgi:superfamily I DNA/RNA helicase
MLPILSSNLTPDQFEAIPHSYDPLFVILAPGTGNHVTTLLICK